MKVNQTLQNVLRIYKEHFHLILPFFFINIALFLYAKKIPYINLYSTELLVLVMLIDWLIVSTFYAFSFKKSLIFALVLFLVCMFFVIIKMEYYAEIIASFIYVLLWITLIKELFIIVIKTNEK